MHKAKAEKKQCKYTHMLPAIEKQRANETKAKGIITTFYQLD